MLPNDLVLFDTLGNVYEWCQNPYSRNPLAGPDREDPAAIDLGLYRVARGGAYVDRAHGSPSMLET